MTFDKMCKEGKNNLTENRLVQKIKSKYVAHRLTKYVLIYNQLILLSLLPIGKKKLFYNSVLFPSIASSGSFSNEANLHFQTVKWLPKMQEYKLYLMQTVCSSSYKHCKQPFMTVDYHIVLSVQSGETHTPG